MSLDGPTITAIGAGAAGVLMAVAAIIAAAKKRENDNDERLTAQISSMRRYINELRRALAMANRRLINRGLDPVEVPVEEEYAS